MPGVKSKVFQKDKPGCIHASGFRGLKAGLADNLDRAHLAVAFLLANAKT
jgi:hypothetical protein